MTMIHDFINLTNLAFMMKYPVMCELILLSLTTWAAIVIIKKVKRG